MHSGKGAHDLVNKIMGKEDTRSLVLRQRKRSPLRKYGRASPGKSLTSEPKLFLFLNTFETYSGKEAHDLANKITGRENTLP